MSTPSPTGAPGQTTPSPPARRSASHVAAPLAAAIAALHGAAAIAAGAFGAHGAEERAAELLGVGARWQSIAAVAGLFCAWRDARAAAWMFNIGGALFAGSLYAVAAGAPSFLFAVTPVGGGALILAWLALAWREAHALIRR